MAIEEIVKKIIDSAFKIHKDYGPGLLESVYETLLSLELQKSGLIVNKQVPIFLTYQGQKTSKAFTADLIVEDLVLVELKSCKKLENVHYKQVKTYLKLTELEIGLLINFNEALLKNGLRRIVN